MRVLVLGATGMLGSSLMRTFVESSQFDVVGTIRSEEHRNWFAASIAERLVVTRDLTDFDALRELVAGIRADAIVNCVSPPRAAIRAGHPLALIPICALLPHQLATICETAGCRLVHISTDAVFSGKKGRYTEDDIPDPTEIYGLSKLLGEPRGGHTVTLRTSMVGHELRNCEGLLEWFLAQNKRCNCFARAVFSGLPTVVLAEIIRDYVLPQPELAGVYHVAARPINKCDLLRLIARTYDKKIEINEDDRPSIDRSLSADKFRRATGYVPPDWPTLVQTMHGHR